MASSTVNPKIFAPANVTAIFTKTMIAQNTSNNGDFSMIAPIEAGIPITTKNKYIKKVPISFAPLIFLKYFAKIVEQATVKVVRIKYLFETNWIKLLSPRPEIISDKVKLIVTIITEIAKTNATS